VSCAERHKCGLIEALRNVAELSPQTPTLAESVIEWQGMLQRDINLGGGWDK
jgi:hypothetical protein|tara:strand:+ start:3093 stop:3248 length:156 start_codon:yes stop_codon:yes gene_type:complete